VTYWVGAPAGCGRRPTREQRRREPLAAAGDPHVPPRVHRCRFETAWRSSRHELVAVAHSIPGTLRQEIVIDAQHRLITDQPARLGGDGSGPSPHELLPAALAACIAATLASYARTKGWELGDVCVAVDYENHSTPRRFDVAIELGGDLTDVQLRRLERAARACPLRRSIEAGFEFDEVIVRREPARSAASAPSEKSVGSGRQLRRFAR